MADANCGFGSLPTDAFVEILLRLPSTTRRLLRFVCKRWRDVVDERIPSRQVAPKILAFFTKTGSSLAVVFSGDGRRGGGQQEWPLSTSGVIDLVGTCNGLLCLRNDDVPRHGDRRIFSTITVANPVTRQRIMIPHSSVSGHYNYGYTLSRNLNKYSFGYHPTTGKYKVVNITCSLTSSSYKTGQLAIDRVRVFTFTIGGDIEVGLSWRDVPAAALVPDSSFHDTGDVVTVDGSAYWLTARADRVMALDLEDDERVTSFEAPPVVQLLQVPTCKLTNVHEQLGVLVMRNNHTPWATRVDVWVMEDGAGHRRRRPARWSRRCSLMEPSNPYADGRWITSPHFTHGEYVLSKREAGGETWLYRHKMGDLTNDGAELWPLKGEEFMCMREVGVMTFPFVETTEPLPICSDDLLAPCPQRAIYFE